MPCYEVRLVTVEFKNKNIDILKEALEKLGYKYSIDERENTITFTDKEGNNYTIRLNSGTIQTRYGLTTVINELKRTYSKIVIEKASMKNKWALRRIDQNKYRAIKY